MDFNVNTTIRSAVALAVGLPVSLGVMFSTMDSDPTAEAMSRVKAPLVSSCINYMVSKNDSKLERSAKDSIDERLGDGGTDYKGLCNWVLG